MTTMTMTMMTTTMQVQRDLPSHTSYQRAEQHELLPQAASGCCEGWGTRTVQSREVPQEKRFGLAQQQEVAGSLGATATGRTLSAPQQPATLWMTKVP